MLASAQSHKCVIAPVRIPEVRNLTLTQGITIRKTGFSKEAPRNDILDPEKLTLNEYIQRAQSNLEYVGFSVIILIAESVTYQNIQLDRVILIPKNTIGDVLIAV